jgi:hexosaminidase
METRYRRLLSKGREKEALAYRLIDPNDKSVYSSAQNFNDNVINVCLPSTYRFLERVIDEVVDIYHQAKVPLSIFHVGGDEVPAGSWTKSPACDQLISNETLLRDVQSLPDYFLSQVYNLLADRGLQLAGWEEIALIENQTDQKPSKIPNEKYLDCNFIPFIWNTIWGWGAEDLGYQLANSGYKIVICNAPNLYFDCAYNKDPQEPGLYWPGFVDTRRAFEFTPLDIFMSATTDRLGNSINRDQYQDHVRLSESGKKNILGIQGQLWGELLVDSTRLDYMAFPKVLGLAERAWSEKPDWSTIKNREEQQKKIQDDWNNFVNCVGQREMVRLDHVFGGISYRIPPPGVIIEEGILKANIAYPGLDIRYTTDDSEPSINSHLYKSPIPVKGTIKLRAFNSIGRGSRISSVSAP